MVISASIFLHIYFVSLGNYFLNAKLHIKILHTVQFHHSGMNYFFFFFEKHCKLFKNWPWCDLGKQNYMQVSSVSSVNVNQGSAFFCFLSMHVLFWVPYTFLTTVMFLFMKNSQRRLLCVLFHYFILVFFSFSLVVLLLNFNFLWVFFFLFFIFVLILCGSFI